MLCFLLALLLSLESAAAQPPGAASIEGHVYNALTGVPIRKAIVTLSAPFGALTAETDPAGKFEFTSLPSATYRLKAGRSGFLGGSARRSILLGQTDQATGAEIRLTPQSALSGRVLDEAGEPVDHIAITLYKQTYKYGRMVWEFFSPNPQLFLTSPNTNITNEGGEYRLADLPRGRYILRAVYQRPQVNNVYGNLPKAFYSTTYYPNVLTQQQATPVDLGVGSELRGVDIHLVKITRPPSVRVRGRITGLPSASAVVSIAVMAFDTGIFTGGGGQAAPPDHVYQLYTPPGEYTLSASVYSGAPPAYGSRTVSVGGDIDGVDLVLTPAPEINGHISVTGNGAHVNLQELNVGMAALSTNLGLTGPFNLHPDATGKLTPLPDNLRRPGVHFALDNIRPLPADYFVREVTLGGQPVSPDDFEISSSAQLEIIVASGAGQITGSVVDGDSKPFPGSIVTLIPADAKLRPARQPVDDSGAFRFPNLPPGKYTLFAWEQVDDDLWPNPEFCKKYADRAIEITVGSNETQTAQLHPVAADEMK